MKTKHFLIGLIVSTPAICSCKKEKAVETDVFTISYSKGSSWVGNSYNATIDQNGLLQIAETNELTQTNRKSEYILVDEDIKMIKEHLNSVVTFDIADKYGFDNENAPTDLPTTKLTYKTTNKSDSTMLYFPAENEIPAELDLFIETVEQVIADNDTLKK